MKREVIDENRASREELKSLVAGLSDADLAKPVGNGWTVATLLCHVAMWDGRAFYALRQWRNTGEVPATISDDAVNVINLASRDVFGTVHGKAAAELAVRRAESLDAFLETLPDAFCARVRAAGFERMLRRSLHRGEHLEKLKQVLNVKAPAA
jgi:hypothetical protein